MKRKTPTILSWPLPTILVRLARDYFDWRRRLAYRPEKHYMRGRSRPSPAIGLTPAHGAGD